MTTPERSRARTRAPQRDAEAFVDELQLGGSEQVYGIAELAEEFGVTHRAIRLYEEKGLLTPRRVGTQRVYSRRDRARLVLILRAKALGSSLEDIKAYLDLYGQRGEGRAKQLAYVIEKTSRAIAELEAKRAQIDRSIAELRHIADTCRAQLAAQQGGAPSSPPTPARRVDERPQLTRARASRGEG